MDSLFPVDLFDQYQYVKSPNRPFIVLAGIDVPKAPNGRRNIAQKGCGGTPAIRAYYCTVHTSLTII